MPSNLGWPRWVLKRLDIEQAGHPSKATTTVRRREVMFWAAILGSKLIGPFKVPDGVKMTAFTYTERLEQNLIPEIHLLEPGLRDNFVFMHDNAPSHASFIARVFLRIHKLAEKRLMN